MPDGTELPLAEARPQYRAMWTSARALADELGVEFSTQRQHEAYSTIWEEVEKSRRLLRPDDVHELLVGVWEDVPRS